MADLDILISKHELAALLEEREASRKHITDLQTRMTQMQEATLARRVRAFHTKFGHPVRTTPAVPTDEEMRFRLSLIGEEFIELLDACLVDVGSGDGVVSEIHDAIRKAIATLPVTVVLEEAYDALLDMAYVIEGTHCVFGTSAEPGLAEVQRANMSKDPVYVQAKDAHHHIGKEVGGGFVIEAISAPDPKAKPQKPADWVAPRIRDVLLAQGWEP